MNQSLFDEQGRRLPYDGMRVYNVVSRRYYKLNQPDFRFDAVLGRLNEHVKTGEFTSAKRFESACLDLKRSIESDVSLRNIFKGVHVPFAIPRDAREIDIGEELEDRWLPAVERSFTRSFPEYHFKAAVQGDLPLKMNLRVEGKSRYEQFLQARRRGVVVGWYFPEALQEYDVASQRRQTDTLPLQERLVLSGGFDTAAALVGSPELLINREFYPPILCLSAFQHVDERLMLCFKAYGLSLEFWCMSQMLTPTTTQVSEQWAGGLTLFVPVD